MNIDMISIGKRIKDRRKELKLTQIDIKHKCGISSGALSEIENGNRTPSVIAFQLLSQALNCSMDWLATGSSSNQEKMFFSEYEDNLLNNFRKLSFEDQEEIVAIIDIKLQKIRKSDIKSSSLPNPDMSNMVG